MQEIKTNTGSTGGNVRVFFAIWPDNAAQKALGGLIEKLGLDSLCGGRKTKAENIHLTLVFVGEVDPGRLDALSGAADEIRDSGRARAFNFAIEEIRYWKHNNVVYGAPAKVPQELIDLVNALQGALSAAGFSLEQRAYAPHVTLMRNAFCPALPKLPEPIAWRAREWVLIKSEQTGNGSVYAPIGRWSLENP